MRVQDDVRLDIPVTPRSTKILASVWIAGIALLEVGLCAMFYLHGVITMASVSAFGVAVFALSTILLIKEYWRTFAVVVYAQVFAQTALSVYCVGWEPGFHLAILSMNVLGFYAEYAARTMRVRTLHAMDFSIVGLLLYVGLLVYVRTHGAAYVLPEETVFGLRIMWGVVANGVLIIYLQLFMLIAHTAEVDLHDRADHDELTGLPNRSYMAEHLAGVQRAGGLAEYWVAIADIDDFKLINDTYGHNCGDYVLRELAGVLTDDAGRYVLCRWGGEEFLLVGRVADSEDPYELLDTLRKSAMDYKFWYDEVRLSVTLTFGMARYSEGQSLIEWVNVADKCLYEGKCNGKNQVVA